jgi:D-tyrosyl-tRNA(Tyr) deacylase
LQRVSSAAVSIDGRPIANIGEGLVVLLGMAVADTAEDAAYLARKTLDLRIFSDAAGRFNLSARDVSAELLIVSQFTLLADTRKGRRPSFIDAAPPETAETLFEQYVAEVRHSGLRVVTGRFQQHMMVTINNDGPVTIWLDSRQRS